MPYKKCPLPPYPCQKDVWDILKEEHRPIFAYGMGNGTDKLLQRFEKYGITIKGVFASDGFVRGHSYRGMRVQSLSEVERENEDFVIVLSFASNRPEVIEMLTNINKKHIMYVPDMPVCGEEYFDKEFYNNNYEKIISAYESLCDEASKNAFALILTYKLTGKMSYLLDCYSTEKELYSLILEGGKINTAFDLGAYNGDTLKQMSEHFEALKRAVALEPDKKTFKRLLKYVENQTRIEIKAVNAAAFSECKLGQMNGSGNRNSSLVGASYEFKREDVDFVTVDSLREEKVDYIKYDVEGAEYEALLGSLSTVRLDRPTLLVSLYHKSGDIFELINFLKERLWGYSFYLRRLMSIPAWEVDLICIPD